MITQRALRTVFIVCLSLIFGGAATAQAADALPSWEDGKAKESIIAFVAKVTQEGSSRLRAAAERIAVFDNDGTLWAEQPMYFPGPLRASTA